MTSLAAVPPAARLLVEFSGVLRRNDFPVAPDQTIGFIEAVRVLGPQDIRDVRRAAVAMLAPPHERREAFDALFRLHFHGQTIAASALESDETDDIVVQDQRDGVTIPPDADHVNEIGGEATPHEALSVRAFSPNDAESVLRTFAKRAPEYLPTRRSRRFKLAHLGSRWDLRRCLRSALRHDDELLSIPKAKRRQVLRRIVLLIDVSGSMKQHTEGALAFAHALVEAARLRGGQVEVFTFGTRLTRITGVLKIRNRDNALASASALVADWDGGTRIGDALEAFLALPRFAGFARGAAVIVQSDGLERGAPDTMIGAVRKLARLAWRVDWLTPLAVYPDFKPVTAALLGILPSIASLGDGSTIQSLCAHALGMAKVPQPHRT